MSTAVPPGGTGAVIPPTSLGGRSEGNLEADEKVLGKTIDEEKEEDEEKVEAPETKEPDVNLPPVEEEEEEEENLELTEEGKEGEEEKEEKEEEEDEDLDKLAGRKTTFRDIKEKYPDLFKTFPDLRDAFFRNEKFSEVYPTPEEAEEAKKSLSGFNFLEATLNNGNPEVLFRVLDKEPLKEVAARFLPSLLRVDREAFDIAMDTVLRNVIRDIAGTAQSTSDQNLLNAAKLLSKHFYNSYDIPQAPKAIEPRQPDPERIKFQQERAAFMAERRETFAQDTFKTGTRLLSKEVIKGLDPENVISPYMRDALVSKIVDEIGDKLETDPQHMRAINSIWSQAERAGYVGDWKSKIIRAYLGRARQLLPVIRQKVRAEFTERKTGKPGTTGRRFVPSTRTSASPNNSGKPVSAKEVDWNKSSDIDVLIGKPTLKK